MAIHSRSSIQNVKGGSGSVKINALLNLTNNQLNIDKIYPYV